MTTVFDGQSHVNLTRICLPTGINLESENPSLVCVEGALAYDVGTKVPYFSDGVHWYPLKYDTCISIKKDITITVAKPEPELAPVQSPKPEPEVTSQSQIVICGKVIPVPDSKCTCKSSCSS